MGDWLLANEAERTKRIVLVGSAPDAPEIVSFIRDDTIVVAINNAWRALGRFDFLAYADDFDGPKPEAAELIRKGLNSVHYTHTEHQFGGSFWCGQTMVFSAGYLCLNMWRYCQLGIFASDMIYQGARTHFYGTGKPDPFRRNVTLQNLRGKSLRLFYHGFKRDSLVVNLSRQPRSNLALPRAPASALTDVNLVDYVLWRLAETGVGNAMEEKAAAALEMEQNPPFDLNAGWPSDDDKSAWEYVARVDAAWEQLAVHAPEIESAIHERIA